MGTKRCVPFYSNAFLNERYGGYVLSSEKGCPPYVCSFKGKCFSKESNHIQDIDDGDVCQQHCYHDANCKWYSYNAHKRICDLMPTCMYWDTIGMDYVSGQWQCFTTESTTLPTMQTEPSSTFLMVNYTALSETSTSTITTIVTTPSTVPITTLPSTIATSTLTTASASITTTTISTTHFTANTTTTITTITTTTSTATTSHLQNSTTTAPGNSKTILVWGMNTFGAMDLTSEQVISCNIPSYPVDMWEGAVATFLD